PVPDTTALPPATTGREAARTPPHRRRMLPRHDRPSGTSTSGSATASGNAHRETHRRRALLGAAPSLVTSGATARPGASQPDQIPPRCTCAGFREDQTPLTCISAAALLSPTRTARRSREPRAG